MSERIIDLAGIGIGPSNLSIAALIQDVPGASAAFFERKPKFDWHPGLLFRQARMQTSFLKDLVTGVCPTSPYSFINYLVQSGRFYQFLSSQVESVGRQEFADYMVWVSRQLPGLSFGTEVLGLDFAGDHFVLQHPDGITRARSVSLGTGRTPYVPPCALPALGERCFHAAEILTRMPRMEGARVAIVGGGQTGAEVFLHALRGFWGSPRELSWISRRPNFEPLDETPFTNELFMPNYVRMFHGLSDERRHSLVTEQKLAGDGISASTLREIYRELYERKLHEDGGGIEMLPARELLGMDAQGRDLSLSLHNGIDGTSERCTADLVIMCTGFQERLPGYLAPLKDRLSVGAEGRLRLGRDFAVQWDGPEENRIYGLNIGRFSHGVAEPQLSVMAWRSAVIINDVLKRPCFNVAPGAGLLRWQGDREPQAQAVVA